VPYDIVSSPSARSWSRLKSGTSPACCGSVSRKIWLRCTSGVLTPWSGPSHLHGYLISKRGQFRWTALPNGHTLLEGASCSADHRPPGSTRCSDKVRVEPIACSTRTFPGSITIWQLSEPPSASFALAPSAVGSRRSRDAFSVQLPQDPRPKSWRDARGVLRSSVSLQSHGLICRALRGARRCGPLLLAYNKDDNNCFGSVESVAATIRPSTPSKSTRWTASLSIFPLERGSRCGACTGVGLLAGGSPW
jgi:hypothetical protein